MSWFGITDRQEKKKAPMPSRGAKPSQGILRRKCSCESKGGAGGCEECRKKEDEPLRRSARCQDDLSEVPPIVYDVLRTSGRPLDTAPRAYFEPRFGHDFSHVRVHTDRRAADSARAVNALAYTVGPNVVFGEGQYRPGHPEGRHLLAHELVHVTQQRRSAPASASLSVGDSQCEAEQEAERLAGGLRPARATSSVEPSLQRQREPEDTRPGNLGPPVEELPLPPRCSVIWKDGKWSFKCEGIPGIGSTPEIPLPPSRIPERLKELLPKGEGDANKGRTIPLPPSPDSPLPPGWFETLCLREPSSPLCIVRPPSSPSGPPAPGPGQMKPTGVFWTWSILFEHDQPPAGGTGGMTSEGLGTLRAVRHLLEADPTLQVQLRAHASSEGDTAHNRELSKRRAAVVLDELTAADLYAQIVDPLEGGAATDGCTRLEFGVWFCGESQATRDKVRPEERRVEVTFLRNPPLPRLWPRLTPPSFGGPKREY